MATQHAINSKGGRQTTFEVARQWTQNQRVAFNSAPWRDLLHRRRVAPQRCGPGDRGYAPSSGASGTQVSATRGPPVSISRASAPSPAT